MGPLVGTPLPNGGGAYRSVPQPGGLTLLAPPPHLAYQTAACYGGQSTEWGSSHWLIRGVSQAHTKKCWGRFREARGYLSGR